MPTGDASAPYVDSFLIAIESFRTERGWSIRHLSRVLGLSHAHWQVVRDRRVGIGRAVLLGAAKIPELKPAVDAYLAAAPAGHRRRKAPEEGAGA